MAALSEREWVRVLVRVFLGETLVEASESECLEFVEVRRRAGEDRGYHAALEMRAEFGGGRRVPLVGVMAVVRDRIFEGPAGVLERMEGILQKHKAGTIEGDGVTLELFRVLTKLIYGAEVGAQRSIEEGQRKRKVLKNGDVDHVSGAAGVEPSEEDLDVELSKLQEKLRELR